MLLRNGHLGPVIKRQQQLTLSLNSGQNDAAADELQPTLELAGRQTQPALELAGRKGQRASERVGSQTQRA